MHHCLCVIFIQVYLPPRVAGIYGGISSFLLCSRVTAGVQLVDPFTLRGLDIPCDKYWRHPFNAGTTLLK